MERAYIFQLAYKRRGNIQYTRFVGGHLTALERGAAFGGIRPDLDGWRTRRSGLFKAWGIIEATIEVYYSWLELERVL